MRETWLDREEAEAFAARALGFLASEPDRFGRFLALSGLEPSTIREAARSPHFLPGVLDHLLGDDALVRAFAEAEGVTPETVGRARAALGIDQTRE